MASSKARLSSCIIDNPYVRPLCIRVTTSLLLVFYIALGAAIFLVLGSEGSDTSDLSSRRNDTASSLVFELGKVRRTQETWVRTVTMYLEEYEGEVLRQKGLNGVMRSPRTFEDAFYFTISILSTTGGCDYHPTGILTKVAIIVYAVFGIPLLAFWLILHGKTVAQTSLLICSNFCCAPIPPGTRCRRLCSVRPIPEESNAEETNVEEAKAEEDNAEENVEDDNADNGNAENTADNAASPANSASEVGSRILDSSQTSPVNTCFRTVTVGTIHGTTMNVGRKHIVCSLLAICFLFVTHVLYGAATAAAIWRQPILECLYWGFLQFSTTSFATHGKPRMADIVPEARVVWIAYFAFGMILIFAALYLMYLLLTWRCWFCRMKAS